jgi:hypothetical protein
MARITDSTIGLASALGAGLWLVVPAIAAPPAMAHDMDHHDNVSPEIHAWVNGLKNQSGVACCATADGWKPDAVEWDFDTNGYKVRIEGKWVDVGEEAVIHGPNKLGHAEVWYYHVDGLPKVRCFLPGEGM